jgi:hypothetical protein
MWVHDSSVVAEAPSASFLINAGEQVRTLKHITVVHVFPCTSGVL